MLEYFGDIGGLAEFFYYFGWLLILPITKFTLDSTIMSNLFDESYFKRSDHDSLSLKERIKSEFKSFRAIELKKGLSDFFCPNKNLKKKIAKAKIAVNKELNLQKFIHRQRVQTTALMGLLSGSQQFFIHRLCKLYIKENLSSSSGSSDEALMVVDKDEERYIDKMVTSFYAKGTMGSDVDRRFLNFFKVMKKEDAIAID